MGIQHIANGIFEQRGDVDWFRMRLVAGQTYKINGPVNLVLNVMLPTGEVMTFPVPFANSLNFVAPVSGDYFLSATSLGISGFYQLTVTDVVDPIPASADTSRSLAVNGSVTITPAENPASSSLNDDWFAIDVVAGQSYLLSTSSGRVYFANADGDILAIEGFLGQGGAQAHFTATETGRIYAGANVSGGSSYTLTLTAVADDHGETPASAGSLSVGGSVNGLWETPGDDDAYAVPLTAGSSYRLAVVNPNVQSSIRIFDAAGTLVWTSQGQARPDLTTFSPEASGTYYVVAGTRESNSNPTGQANYTLSADLLANDLTDNVLTTGLLAVGGDVGGVFETPGDHDWVRIELVEGQSYLFTMEAQNWQDSGMALYDAQGGLVRKAGTTFFGSQLHHTAETTGTYYVAAISGQQPGNYTLSAEAVEDDYADNASTTGVAVVNGFFSGVFEVNNDVDWFAVELVAGRTYSVEGAEVYDAAGTLLTMSNWGDASFTAAATGIYYLAVAGLEGEYEYGIVQIADDYLESAATTGVVRQEIVGTTNPDIFVSTERYESFQGLGGDDLFVGGSGYDFFLGGAGIDTLSYANAGAGMEISMLLGRGQRGAGQPYDVFSSIENITGSAFNDVITGNGAANLLDGGGGTDTLIGGAGNDSYRVDEAGDAVVEAAAGGFDSVYTVVSYALAAGSEVELLSAIDPGSTVGLSLTGNEFANTLIGTAGSDTLIGGGTADTLIGGAGNDVYRVEDAGDVVVEAVAGGFDTVYAVGSYTLAAGSEVELLSAFDPASTAAINLTGNGLTQTITGNAGANVLDGGGGVDTLTGLGGDDIYFVDGADDAVVEAAGQGYDTVYTSANYTLANGRSIEVLSAASWAGAAPFVLGGNELANVIYGNAGHNVLDGGGGADILNGFGGDDVYIVDSAGDAVVEANGGGYDTVFTLATYALGEGVHAEVLSTIDWTSTSALNLTGNALANRIYGNAGANVLTGGAGDDVLWGVGGGDMLIGGAGEDVYWIFALDDAVVESGAAGYDTAYLFTSYALAADANVEVVSTFNWLGTEAIDLTGNGLGNTVFGNAGVNTLNGGGGADYLVGLGGADTFAFTTALGGGNVDTIGDFAAGTDKIALDDAIFTAIGGGTLNASAFVIGSAAADADDRIVYNSATGALFYDADGNGAGAAVQFATLTPGLTLAASDFAMI